MKSKKIKERQKNHILFAKDAGDKTVEIHILTSIQKVCSTFETCELWIDVY